jgi:hypothetical protein
MSLYMPCSKLTRFLVVFCLIVKAYENRAEGWTMSATAVEKITHLPNKPRGPVRQNPSPKKRHLVKNPDHKGMALRKPKSGVTACRRIAYAVADEDQPTASTTSSSCGHRRLPSFPGIARASLRKSLRRTKLRLLTADLGSLQSQINIVTRYLLGEQLCFLARSNPILFRRTAVGCSS